MYPFPLGGCMLVQVQDNLQFPSFKNPDEQGRLLPSLRLTFFSPV